MALMTNKMRNQLYDLQYAVAAAESGTRSMKLYNFVRMSISGIYRTCEEFDSRKDLQEHIDTLADLITTKINSR